jgi:hypothetical protein
MVYLLSKVRLKGVRSSLYERLPDTSSRRGEYNRVGRYIDEQNRVPWHCNRVNGLDLPA